jgi:hypothetical protein
LKTSDQREEALNRQIERLVGVALLTLGGMYLVGCGGGGGASSTPTHGKAATTASTPPSPLTYEEARLNSAGYRTTSEEGGGGAAAALSVEPPGVEIDYYVDPNRAAVAGDQLRKVFSQRPGRGEATVRGRRVYWIAEEHSLTGKERAEFARIVAVAEGSG